MKLKKLTLSLLLGLSSLAATHQAHAFGEKDPVALSALATFKAAQYTPFVTRVYNQFYAINTYLAQIYAYMSSGSGDTGTGIVGTLNKIWAQQRPYMEAVGSITDTNNKKLAHETPPAHVLASRMPDPRNCSDIGKKYGARAGGGGSGYGSKMALASAEKKMTVNGVGSKTSDSDYAEEIYREHGDSSIGTCSSTDANLLDKNGNILKSRGAFGCSAKGPMPNGDVRVQSILRPAVDYEKVESGDRAELIKSYSLTYSPVQFEVAKRAAKNLVSAFQPSVLPKDVESSSSGKALLAKQKVYEARISPAQNALSNLMAKLSPSAPGNTFLSNAWRDSATGVYQRLFPGYTPPDSPSEEEVLRFEDLRRFSDFGDGSWAQELDNDQDQTKVLKMMAHTQAVELHVLNSINDRLKDNNLIQVAILAQLTNPITKTELSNLSNQALKRR